MWQNVLQSRCCCAVVCLHSVGTLSAGHMGQHATQEGNVVGFLQHNVCGDYERQRLGPAQHTGVPTQGAAATHPSSSSVCAITEATSRTPTPRSRSFAAMLPAALQGPRVAGPPITRVLLRSVSYSNPMTSLLPFPVWGSGCWASKRNARVWQKAFGVKTTQTRRQLCWSNALDAYSGSPGTCISWICTCNLSFLGFWSCFDQ